MAQTHKQTDRQTDEHGDSMTESAQWGQFNEEEKNTFAKEDPNTEINN